MLIRDCKAPCCDKKAEYGKYECPGHRQRMRKHGSYGDTPLKRVPPRGLSGWDVVLFNGWLVTDQGCWEYLGPRFANGYGQVKIDGTPTLLHRVSYEFHKGKIPAGLMVRHKCDNKPCMNPDHLETGTAHENVQDRQERGRTARGNQARGYFTDSQVREIRDEIANYIEEVGGNRLVYGKKYGEIAERYSVSRSCVHNIWLRKTYTHVEGGRNWQG